MYPVSKFTLCAAALLSFLPLNTAVSGDVVYVVRPPASVGMKSAGVLPNDAFASKDSNGGSPSNDSTGYVWKSEGFDRTEYTEFRTGPIGKYQHFAFEGFDGCRLDGTTIIVGDHYDDIRKKFTWGAVSGYDAIGFQPLVAGRFLLSMSCAPTDIDGETVRLRHTAEVVAY